LRTRAIPERLRCVITTRRYTNPRLPLPYLTIFYTYSQCFMLTFTTIHINYSRIVSYRFAGSCTVSVLSKSVALSWGGQDGQSPGGRECRSRRVPGKKFEHICRFWAVNCTKMCLAAGLRSDSLGVL